MDGCLYVAGSVGEADLEEEAVLAGPGEGVAEEQEHLLLLLMMIVVAGEPQSEQRRAAAGHLQLRGPANTLNNTHLETDNQPTYQLATALLGGKPTHPLDMSHCQYAQTIEKLLFHSS